MQKKIVLLSLLILLNTTSWSQIVITSANMPSSGDTIRFSSASLNSIGNYTITGANYLWDFSTLDSTSQKIRKFETAFKTPYIFFGSGFGEKTADSVGVSPFQFKNIYSFYKNNASKFIVDGLGITFSGLPIPNFYSDKDELYQFPLKFGNRDSSTFKFTTVSTGTIPSYSKQGHRITEVDGWGTIKTPYGTENCLRLVTTQYSHDSVKGSITIGTFTLPLNFGFKNYARSYQWLTLTEKIPFLEVSGIVNNGIFTINSIKYRDTKHTVVGLEEKLLDNELNIFPNPTNNEINLIIPESTSNGLVELYDIQGKKVLSELIEGKRFKQLDVSKLPKGLYILTITSEFNHQTLKILIQ